MATRIYSQCFHVSSSDSQVFKSRALEGVKQKHHRYVDRWQCLLHSFYGSINLEKPYEARLELFTENK